MNFALNLSILIGLYPIDSPNSKIYLGFVSNWSTRGSQVSSSEVYTLKCIMVLYLAFSPSSSFLAHASNINDHLEGLVYVFKGSCLDQQ